MHGTVDAVVDRLAILETDRREPVDRAAASRRPPAPAAPPRAPMPQADEAYPGPMSIIEPKLEPKRAPATSAVTVTPPVKARPPMSRPRTPIDPNLPPDYPLEPGSGIPRERGTSAAERIAASEAALERHQFHRHGQLRIDEFHRRRAPRRAGRRARRRTPPRKPKPAKSEKPAEHKSIGQRVRSMLAGASVILLVAGGLKLAMNLFDSTDQVAELPAASPAQIANSNADDLTALIQDKTGRAPAPRITRVPDRQRRRPTLYQQAGSREPDAPDVTSSIGTAPLAARDRAADAGARRPISGWCRRKNSPPRCATQP